MAKSTICPVNSLHHAFRYETLRAQWLSAIGRKTEADHAEQCASHFRMRLRDETGIEV